MNKRFFFWVACTLTPLYAVIDVDALKEAAKTWKTEHLLTDTNNNALCLNVKKYLHDDDKKLMKPKELFDEVLDTLTLNPHNLGKNEQLMLSDYVIQMMVGQIKQYQPSGKSANDVLKNIMAQLFIMVGDKVKGVAGAKDRFTDMIQKAPQKIAEVDDVSWTNHLANMNDAILAGIEGKQKENVNNFVRDALKPMYEDAQSKGKKATRGTLAQQILISKAPVLDDDSLIPLKAVQKISLEGLQKIKAVATYPWILESLGNMLNVKKTGELNVSCPLIEQETGVLKMYKELNDQIKDGIIIELELDVDSENMEHAGARCRGETKMILKASKSFIGQQALFGSGGPIEFASPLFDFDTCFIDVNPQKTTIKIAPHASVKSPIKYILIKPKSSPLLIQGKIDFKMPSFKDFIVSRSDFEIHFH